MHASHQLEEGSRRVMWLLCQCWTFVSVFQLLGSSTANYFLKYFNHELALLNECFCFCIINCAYWCIFELAVSLKNCLEWRYESYNCWNTSGFIFMTAAALILRRVMSFDPKKDLNITLFRQLTWFIWQVGAKGGGEGGWGVVRLLVPRRRAY